MIRPCLYSSFPTKPPTGKYCTDDPPAVANATTEHGSSSNPVGGTNRVRVNSTFTYRLEKNFFAFMLRDKEEW